MYFKKTHFIYLMILSNLFLTNSYCFSQIIEVKGSILPLDFIHPNHPYLTGGLEVILKEKLGLEINYGQRVLPYGVFFEKPYEQITAPATGKKIQLEAKLYNIIGEKIYSLKNHQTYIGICYMKINDTRNLAIIYWVPYEDEPNIYHSSTEHTAIKKSIAAMNVVGGYVYSINRIKFDGSIMFGVKKKIQNYIENEYYELGYDSYRHWVWDQPMDSYRPSFNFRFKVSYRII